MKRRCNMSVQKMTEETSLHICSLPFMDIHLYVETHLDVLEGNRSLYRRTLSVEDHCETFLSDDKSESRVYFPNPPVLLTPSSPGASPPGVSAAKRPCGTAAGVLAVQSPQILPAYDVHDPLLLGGAREDSQSGTSSKTLVMGNRKTKQRDSLSVWSRQVKANFTLQALAPGEEVEVQIAVKCALNANAGHWSSWSRPERAVVPQSAGELHRGGGQGCLWSCDTYCQQQKQDRPDHPCSASQVMFHCCAWHPICRGWSVSGTPADMVQRRRTRLPTPWTSGAGEVERRNKSTSSCSPHTHVHTTQQFRVGQDTVGRVRCWRQQHRAVQFPWRRVQRGQSEAQFSSGATRQNVLHTGLHPLPQQWVTVIYSWLQSEAVSLLWARWILTWRYLWMLFSQNVPTKPSHWSLSGKQAVPLLGSSSSLSVNSPAVRGQLPSPTRDSMDGKVVFYISKPFRLTHNVALQTWLALVVSLCQHANLQEVMTTRTVLRPVLCLCHSHFQLE